MTKTNKVTKIISQAINRRRTKHPKYSLSWLARDLKVSRVFVSSIISGKKKIPLDRLDEIIKSLDMDEVSKNSLLEAIVDDTLSELASQNTQLHKVLERRKKSLSHLKNFEKFKEIPDKKISLLNPWYHVAMLDLISTKDFRLDFNWMKTRLGIPVDALKRSWNFLIENRFIEQRNGQWIKADGLIRVPTQKSQKDIREYHENLILKGLHTMNTKTDQESFDKRLISGVTFAANSKNIEDTKLLLHDAQYSAVDNLREGDCNQVYHLALMLYPLTQD